jgi:hypothetical protein
VFIVIHLYIKTKLLSKFAESRHLDSYFSHYTFASIKEGVEKYKFCPQIVYNLVEIVDNFAQISTSTMKISEKSSYPHLKYVEYALTRSILTAIPPSQSPETLVN